MAQRLGTAGRPGQHGAVSAVLLEIVVAPADADLLAGRLWALGTTGVEERAEAERVVLVAAFPTAAAAEEVAALLSPAYEVGTVTVADPASLEMWRNFAQPVDIGERLRVVPASRELSVAAGRTNLRIEPGPCFGTGAHPTTVMLLAQLERRVAPSTTVLDVGTGSGILAVAAAKLGAAGVVAIDIDPESPAITATNAAANGVSDLVDASATPLADVEGRFDIVLANLSAATLVSLADDLIGALADDGVILASGMLPGQWRHVGPAFARLVPETVIEADGWIAVPLRKPPLP